MLKVGNRHWHTRIDSKTAAFHPNEKSNQISAWHTKFHGISNIQTWMWSTSHSYGFYDKFYFMPINPFIHFPMAHRWSDRLSFFRSSSYAFGFFRTASSLFTNRLVLCPKTRPAQKQQHKQQQQQQQQTKQQTIAKPFQNGWVLTGCNFNEVRTRCERGQNEVRNQILGDWPLSLLTNSLVATRFRIFFRTVKLKSFQRWSGRGNQAKQQLQARERRQKRRQRASKGDRGETKGRKLGKQGGGDKFERAQTFWDVGTVIAR